MVTYAQDVVLGVRPFTTQVEGEEVIIGNAEAGIFLAVPPEAAGLLEDLARGKTVGQVAHDYEQKYGETPDLDEFLSLLEAKGFVEAPGASGEPDGLIAARPPERRYHFSNFPQGLAQRLFSKPALIGSLVIVALALVAIASSPSITPVPHDLFFPDRRALTWAIVVFVDLVTVVVHELAHLVAARAQGVNSRMGMSNRLWNVVAETDLTGLWGVPRKQRYMPMLAGMLVDLVSGSLLVLLLFAQHNHWVTVPAFCLRLIRAIAFSYVMRIVWEFFLFLRTDVYYVIATFFSCKSLLADTQVFLRNQVGRFIRSIAPVDQSAIPASEFKVIRAYAFVWTAGRIWALTMLFWVTIPVSLSYVQDLNHVIRAGYATNPANFIDAIVVATIVLVPTTAGLILWVRGFVSHQRG